MVYTFSSHEKRKEYHELYSYMTSIEKWAYYMFHEALLGYDLLFVFISYQVLSSELGWATKAVLILPPLLLLVFLGRLFMNKQRHFLYSTVWARENGYKFSVGESDA